MSIFKDTFRRYVRDQLSLREEIIDIGNTNDQGIKSNRNSIKNDIELQSGTVVKKLDAGAFYNYTLSKQCIIRATSMVDYVENVNLEIGGLEGENSFNSLKGAALSQNFILEGGVLSDFARVKDGNKITRRVTTPRDSFPRPGQRTNLGYGDLAIGADALNDGYGIVPMPGIIDINVRTKSAYGSLREAKVNFECHNRRQLEVLEMLYMRPGYMVVLEWGWTPYINNEGTLYKEKRLLEDITNGRIYTNDITQQEVFNAINKLKEFHCGNYDGFLGFVKNFGFQARNDGGYSCYTELVSIGEVIESLKIPNISITNSTINIPGENGEIGGQSNITIETPKTTRSVKDDAATSTSTLSVNQATFNEALEAGIFPRYNGLLGLIKSLSNYCVFNSFSRGNSNNNRNIEFENQQLGNIFEFVNEDKKNAATDDQKELLEEQEKTAKDLASDNDYNNAYFRDFLKDLVKFQSTSLEKYLQKTLQLSTNNKLLNYIIPIGGSGKWTKRTDEEGRKRNTQPYIRWDALCVLINENLITKDEKSQNPITIVSDRIYDEGGGFSKLDPLLYVPITDYISSPTNNLLDFSCDSNVCILPLQFETNTLATVGGNIDAYDIKESLGYIPDTSVFPANYIVGTYDRELPIKYDGLEITHNPNFNGPPNPNPIPLTKTDQLRRIGSIFLNINMLNNIAEKNAGEDNYTLGKFLNDIWGEVNKACPNHNFVVTDDKESNTIFVIDLPVDNSAVPNTEDLHEFIPFSNKNNLRKFEYTSNVPKALSATIAIQSQDPRSIQDIDGVTFAAFNRSIKNRLLSTDITSNYDKTQTAVKNNKQSLLNKQNQLRQQIDRYILRFFTNLKLVANESAPEVEGNIKNILKEYQKNAAYLSTTITDTSTFNSVIPLEFSATIDGIAGVVIGNMFKVRKDRLPKAYSKSNIGFIVFNEDQKINGQDWTTDISGKMVLLPPKEKPIISGVSVIASPTFINEGVLNENSVVSLNSETRELAEGQDAPTDIADATDGKPVFLKKIKDNSITTILIPGPANDWDIPDDLPNVYKGKTVNKSHAFTSLRSTPEIDNGIRGFNNFIGMFNSWEDGGILLGIIKDDGIRKVEYEGGRVRLLQSRYSNYFNLDEEDIDNNDLITFTPDKINGRTTTNIDGVEYYVVTKTLKKNTDMKDINTEEIILSNDNETKRYIRKSDTSTTSAVWYNIKFDPSVDDKFYNGWSRKGSNISVDSATDNIFRNGTSTLSEYSKNNDCWMRFDTLAATSDSAIRALQPIDNNDEFPEEDENNPDE